MTPKHARLSLLLLATLCTLPARAQDTTLKPSPTPPAAPIIYGPLTGQMTSASLHGFSVLRFMSTESS